MKFRSDLTKEENNPVKKKIVSRLDSSKVLFEYEGELKGANLSGADLSGAKWQEQYCMYIKRKQKQKLV